MKNIICKFFGHDKGSWFRTVQGATSQHAFSNGVQCYRCGKLLGVWGDKSEYIEMDIDCQAPEPIDLTDKRK